MKFVTLFGKTGNVHLTKDIGLIPFYLDRESNFDTKLVTMKMPEDYVYLESEVKGLEVEFIKKYFDSTWYSELVYIIRNAKKIDILNLYHLNLRVCLQFTVYRLLNKKGFSFLKLDIDNRFFYGKKEKRWKKAIYKYTLRKVDLATAECTKICNELKAYSGCEIKYLPNGFLQNSTENLRSEKSNEILTVARLGTNQKNTQLLVSAFVKAKLDGWSLNLVGDATEEFKNFINEIKVMHPECKNTIKMTGYIADKERLSAEYFNAKIFALPSRFESFGIVILEAMAAGDYIVVSDGVSPANDLIINEHNGMIFKNENEDDLVRILKKATATSEYYECVCIEERMKFANDNFSWEKVCKDLGTMIHFEWSKKNGQY